MTSTRGIHSFLILLALSLPFHSLIATDFVQGPGGIPTKPWVDPVPPAEPPLNPVEPPSSPGDEPPGGYPHPDPYPSPPPDYRLRELIEELRSQIRELRRRVEILESYHGKKIYKKTSPCMKEAKRVQAALVSFAYDMGKELQLDGSSKPFEILLEEGYLKVMPVYASRFRQKTGGKVYCK